MNIKRIIFSLIIIIVLSGCSQVVVKPTNYYILEYNTIFEDSNLVRKTPFDVKVMVMNAEIPKAYSRNQIVSRSSQYKISYMNNELWSSKLSNSIPRIINKKFNRYNIFAESSQSFITDAEYSLITNINSVEFLEYGEQYAAHIEMEMILKNNSTEEVKVKYSTNRQKKIGIRDIEQFVQTINEMLMDETDIFISLIEDSFARDTEVILSYSPKETNGTKKHAYQQSSDLINKGKLYLPIKTESRLEPSVQVLTPNDAFVGDYNMGEDIILDPGNYTVKFGSGSNWQKIRKDVTIKKGYRLLLDPDWAWLQVNIIDQNRTSLDVRYELFDVESNASLGMGSGVNEELGEKLETWVLQAGTYKITVNGVSFNTYIDFTTVDLRPSKLTEVTVVLDSETGNLVGAGRIHSSKEGSLFLSDEWKISSALHANANMISENETNQDNFQNNFDFSSQFDTRVTYDKFPYNYISKNLIELGTSKNPDSNFEISLDNFDWKNTFVYYFNQRFGMYTRLDLNTHFFHGKYYPNNDTNYAFISTENDTTFYQNPNSIIIQPSFFPISFKEGLGANIRVLNSTKYKLYLRSGFGMRQDFNNEVYSLDGTSSVVNGVTYQNYKEFESLFSEGLEFSIVSNIKLYQNVTYSSNFDALFPFDNGKSNSFDLENLINIKLLKYISFDYKLNLRYNKDVTDYTTLYHNFFLRFTYLIY